MGKFKNKYGNFNPWNELDIAIACEMKRRGWEYRQISRFFGRHQSSVWCLINKTKDFRFQRFKYNHLDVELAARYALMGFCRQHISKFTGIPASVLTMWLVHERVPLCAIGFPMPCRDRWYAQGIVPSLAGFSERSPRGKTASKGTIEGRKQCVTIHKKVCVRGRPRPVTDWFSATTATDSRAPRKTSREPVTV